LKKSLIIFLILLVLTLGLPAMALIELPKTESTNELVTIFSADISSFEDKI